MVAGRYPAAVLVAVAGCSLFAAPPPPEKESAPSVVWKTADGPTRQPGMTTPLVAGKFVVVGTAAGELRAYRAETGEPAWTHSLGKRITQNPTADAERVYVPSAAGLSAVTLTTGKVVWEFGIPQGGGPTVVLSDRGRVVVASHDGNLYALDAKTGDREWTAEFLTDAPPDPPGVDGKRARRNNPARPRGLVADAAGVYLSVFDQSRMAAYDAATGKRRWSYQTGGWVGDPVVTADRVLLGSQDKRFHCVDKATGRVAWTFESKRSTAGQPVVDGESVYFGGADGGLYALRLSDGTQRWRFRTDADPKIWAGLSAPVFRRGAAYFACSDGQLYAVEVASGTLRWKLRLVEQAGDLTPNLSLAADASRFFVSSTQLQPMGGGEGTLLAVGTK